jgi:hypothetical protein
LPSIFGGDAKRLSMLSAAFLALALALALAWAPKPALAQEAQGSESFAAKEAAALDCGDFATRRGAQAIFDRSPVASAGDRFELDEDGDGVVCEPAPGGAAEDGTDLGAQTGGDLDCVDFPSQAAAQAGLRDDPSDPNRLDPENNGVACELTPVFYDDGATDYAPVAAARSNADLDCEDFEFQQEAQMVYLRDESDPNGLDGPNEAAEKDKRYVGNGFACETLPLLASNVEYTVGKGNSADAEDAGAAGPLALVSAWPHGGGLGLLLDMVALSLVTFGVVALLTIGRARHDSGG